MNALQRLVNLGAELRTGGAANRAHAPVSASVRELVRLGQEVKKAAQPNPPAASSDRESFIRRAFPALATKLRADYVERVGRLNSAQRALWQMLEEDVDLLSPSGKQFQETTHTGLMASFLDPARRPLTGVALLRPFVSRVRDGLARSGGKASLIAVLEHALESELGSAGARAESLLEKRRRADVLVRLPSCFLVIEAKIHAALSRTQLANYRAWIASEEKRIGRPGLLVVVAPEEHDVHEERDVLTLRWKELWDMWMPVAIAGAGHDHWYLRAYLHSVAVWVEHFIPAGSPRHWTLSQQLGALRGVERCGRVE